MKNLILKYGNEIKSYVIEGDCITGKDIVLLDEDDDLTAHSTLSDEGFGVFDFIPQIDFNKLHTGISNLIAGNLGIREENFSLEKYHNYVTDDGHLKITQFLKNCLPIENFPIDHHLILDRIGEILGFPVTLLNKYSSEIYPMFCLRIVRPMRGDNNPLHRDVWLDRLRHAINIYAPIAGSDENSSLALVPTSHRWMESEIERTSEGATVDGVRFTVPAVTATDRPLHLIRPSPKSNEFMLFSPYLIHGGGINQNIDITRVSLEMRFWRK